MILKLTNKNKNFYQYMGKFFGSRIVQKETSDRIYDDSDKIWYIYIKKDVPVGFISIKENTIKNIYAIKDEYVYDLLVKVQKDILIAPSTITKLYLDIYQKCSFHILNNNYKNFVTICSTSFKTGEAS